MPRVVRDVIRIARTIRPPVREPPTDGPALLPPDAQLPVPVDAGQEIVEWQVLIVIHTIPDGPRP